LEHAASPDVAFVCTQGEDDSPTGGRWLRSTLQFEGIPTVPLQRTMIDVPAQ